jgi:hypothetical protein
VTSAGQARELTALLGLFDQAGVHDRFAGYA